MDEEKKVRIMTKKELAIRLAIWLVLAVITPLVYIGVAYGLFSAPSSDVHLSGWGIIALVFTAICLMYIIAQARKALPYGSFIRQCIDGIMGLIPLFVAILLLEVVKNNVANFQRFLIVVLACEAVAVPVNPMPKWAMQNHIDFAYTTLFECLSRAFLATKEKEKKA